MSDSFTEVTRQSWGSRLKGSFKGIVIGLVLIAVAFFVLFKNEGRAVSRYKTLKEGSGVVVPVSATAVDPSNDGKLVHMTGRAEGEVLTDPVFGVSADAIHLERRVEMFQWRERSESTTEKKLGGGTETRTTYSYSTGWADRHIDSSSFRRPEGHQNPARMPFESRTATADEVRLGVFRLSPGLVAGMRRDEAVSLGSLAELPESLRSRARRVGDMLYLAEQPASPRVGDVRISFSKVPPATVSVVARQQGDRLVPYRARTGGSVELLSYGAVAADQMFATARQSNKILTWILRAVGFFVMLIGLRTVFRPLSVMADVVPAFGTLVGKGTGLVAFMIAAFLSLTTIALAWFFYRPLIGVPLLLGALALGYLAVRSITRARRAGAARAVPPPPPPPPPPAPDTA